MKYMFLAVSAFLAIVAQMIAGNNFFLFNFLDLSLVLIAYWAIYRNRVQALFVGSLTGLMLDAVLGWPLGFNGFGKTLAAFIIGQVAKHFNVEAGWIRFVLISGASCLSSLSMFALWALLQRPSSSIFLGASLMQALITGAAGALIFGIMDVYAQTHVKKAS
jgi:rod shape-determining protein MreD